MSRPKIDPDIKVLKACCRALDKSTSPKMLRANLWYLWDRYVLSPRHTPDGILLRAPTNGDEPRSPTPKPESRP